MVDVVVPMAILGQLRLLLVHALKLVEDGVRLILVRKGAASSRRLLPLVMTVMNCLTNLPILAIPGSRRLHPFEYCSRLS